MNNEKNSQAVVIRRTLGTGFFVPDGQYQAQITALSIEQKPDLINPGSKRDVLRLLFAVQVNPNHQVTLNYFLNVSWYAGSPLSKFLENFECLPDMDEDVDLSVLIARKAVVKVENQERGKKSFSNIVAVQPIKSSPPSTATISTNLVKERPKSLDSAFFDDIMLDDLD